MPTKKKSAKAVAVDKKAAKTAGHTHEAPLQEKLKQKDWDPIKEILEITDEYEAGTPRREGGKDYWGACCLESQDVDVAQQVRKTAGNAGAAQHQHDHNHAKEKDAKPAQKKAAMKPPIPK